jgi:hypothetical protein
MRTKSNTPRLAVRCAALGIAVPLSLALLLAVTEGMHVDRLGNGASVFLLDSVIVTPTKPMAQANQHRGYGSSRAG